jgi:nicotinate phosphoribosyltransferase
VSLSQKIRACLPGTKILASGDLDEVQILALQKAGAELDGYGIGTKLVTGTPINGIYKLVDIDGIPVMKESSGKATYPGRKQIYRRYDREGMLQQDRLGLMDEAPEPGEIPLLEKVMEDGKCLKLPESIETIAPRVAQNVAQLPSPLRQIHQPAPPPVQLSQPLTTLIDKTRRTL